MAGTVPDAITCTMSDNMAGTVPDMIRGTMSDEMTNSMTDMMIKRIGCILMASGSSVRYGKNKLMEKLDGREIILHTAGNLMEAGFGPLAVTRSEEVKELLDREGIPCLLHDGARKSDTMRAGIRNLDPDAAGYLFMPADQPLVLPASLRKLADRFAACPSRAVRLGFEKTAGSPVLFPAYFRDYLLAYTGDRGGMEVLRQKHLPCDVVQASFTWELWDVDTPEKMGMVKKTWKHYIAFIKFRGRTHRMPVSGVNDESVMKEVTDFYIDFLEAKKDEIEVNLKEITKYEK